jgi:hypothetical protein
MYTKALLTSIEIRALSCGKIIVPGPPFLNRVARVQHISSKEQAVLPKTLSLSYIMHLVCDVLIKQEIQSPSLEVHLGCCGNVL